MKNKRGSNYELMRIISMFLIVLYHFIVYTNIIENSSGIIKVLCIFLESITLVHVNSFILLTGYFQYDKETKLHKIIKIINQTWFYKSIIMITLILIGFLALPDRLTIFRTLFPIDYNTYWYINCYLILYMISPILNKIIKCSNKKEHFNYILILVFIVSILSTISKDVYFNSYTGRSLSTFILLYLIGAYLRKYPIKYNKKIKNKKRFNFLCYIFFATLSTLMYCFYIKFSFLESISKEFVRIFGFMHISYSSPLIIIQTIFYFLYFGTLNFESRIVKKVSGATLAVYLISENIFIRENAYDKFGISNIYPVNIVTIFKIFLACLVIYSMCIIIELIRQYLCNKIFNFKAIKKLKTQIKNKIINLKIKMIKFE